MAGGKTFTERRVELRRLKGTCNTSASVSSALSEDVTRFAPVLRGCRDEAHL